MNSRDLPLAVAVIATLACAREVRPNVPAGAGPQTNARCLMAKTALDAAFHATQGLDSACVGRVASTGGHIIADAFFANSDEYIQTVIDTPCEIARYRIRFDVNNYVTSPAEGVVIVTFIEQKSGEWDFHAGVDRATWRSRRENVYSTSMCGVAIGKIRKSATGWSATLSVE